PPVRFEPLERAFGRLLLREADPLERVRLAVPRALLVFPVLARVVLLLVLRAAVPVLVLARLKAERAELRARLAVLLALLLALLAAGLLAGAFFERLMVVLPRPLT